MTSKEALQTLLKSYWRYYNVKDEGVEAPFDAEAEVILKDKNGDEVRKTLAAGTHTFTL